MGLALSTTSSSAGAMCWAPISFLVDWKTLSVKRSLESSFASPSLSASFLSSCLIVTVFSGVTAFLAAGCGYPASASAAA